MKLSRVLYIAITAVLGGLAGILLARSGGLRYLQISHRPFAPLIIVAVETLALWAVISTHEAGHLFAALSVGFRGLLYVSGPLYFHRDDRGWRLRLNRNVALYGGIVSALPTSMHRLREKLIVMVAGGPLASLLSGLIALALIPITAPISLPRATLASYAVMSLTIVVVTLVPSHTIGYLTDGARLIRLIRGGSAVDRDNAVMMLLAASHSGARPREWDRDVLDVVTAPADDPRERLTAARYAFGYALDIGDINAARSHLVDVVRDLELLPRPIHAMMLVNASYFAARYDRDVAQARLHLERARGVWKMPVSATSLADAAIAHAEGRVERIPDLLSAAEQALAHSIDRGSVRVAREIIASLRDGAPIDAPASDAGGV